jgi:hypothetical protein
MSNLDEACDLRERYTRFHILVIGRANAGKNHIPTNHVHGRLRIEYRLGPVMPNLALSQD